VIEFVVQCVELSVAGVSLTVLLGFTFMFFFESLEEAFRVRKPADLDADDINHGTETSVQTSDDVDPRIGI
jgi:hypothetical protein